VGVLLADARRRQAVDLLTDLHQAPPAIKPRTRALKRLPR
jgi:hypothetical protein